MLTQHSRFAGPREYLRVFFSHLALIVFVVVVVVGAAVLATLSATPTYVAVAKILARPGAVVTPIGYEAAPPEDRARFLETQKEIIISTSVAQRALDNLKADNPEFREEFLQVYGKGSEREQIAALQGLVSVYSRSGAGVNAMLGSSDIGESYIINIATEFRTADQAAQLANAVADRYIDRYWEMARKDATSQSEFLQGQVQQAQDDLHKAEEALRQFEEANSQDLAEILSYEKGGLRVYSNLSDFEANAARLDADIAKQQNIVDEVRKRQSTLKEFLVDPDKLARIDEQELSRRLFLPPDAMAENPSLASALDRVNALRLDLVSMTSKFTDEYRPIQMLRDEIKQGLVIVGDLLEQDLAGREARTQASMAEKQSLEHEIGQYQQRLKRLAEQKSVYGSLARAVGMDEEIYKTRMLEYERAKLAKDIRPQDQASISILDPAYPPLAPARPNKRLNIALGLLIGFALAFGLAFLVDSWDHSIKTVYDVERHLEVPVVAAISKHKAGA